MNQSHGRRSDDQPIRVAVVGAGIMGTNHARVISTVPGLELMGIVDPDPARAAALAKFADVEVLEIDELPGRVDAAVLASPSDTHATLGCRLLDSGVDLLVEKPIATSVEDAQRLVDSAAKSDGVLMIGHIERFNPAVIGLQRVLTDPLHIEFTRTGAYSGRIMSDVFLDLMIHDLDLAFVLSGASTFTSLHSVGRPLKSGVADIASCLLAGDNGVTVTLTASRAGQNKIRSIEVTQGESFVTADLLRQDVNVHRVAHSEFVTNGGTSYRQSGVVEIPFLERSGEPLRVELEVFRRCVAERTEPPVTGTDGLIALELALRLSALAGEN